MIKLQLLTFASPNELWIKEFEDELRIISLFSKQLAKQSILTKSYNREDYNILYSSPTLNIIINKIVDVKMYSVSFNSAS